MKRSRVSSSRIATSRRPKPECTISLATTKTAIKTPTVTMYIQNRVCANNPASSPGTIAKPSTWVKLVSPLVPPSTNSFFWNSR